MPRDSLWFSLISDIMDTIHSALLLNKGTIFPTEERVITYYPRPEILELIETEEARITINITYYSAQKKYYTSRIMNILKGKGLDKGRFPFNFIDTEDSWD